MRILVVANQEPIATLFHDALTVAGCSVEVVADDARAVQRVLAEDFDLVVVDVGLPGNAALGVVQVLQRAMTITPVLVVTSKETVRTALDPDRPCR